MVSVACKGPVTHWLSLMLSPIASGWFQTLAVLTRGGGVAAAMWLNGDIPGLRQWCPPHPLLLCIQVRGPMESAVAPTDSPNSKEEHEGLEPPSTTPGSELHRETNHARLLVFTSPGSVVSTAACLLPVGRTVERRDKLRAPLHQRLKPLDATALFYALSCLSPIPAWPVPLCAWRAGPAAGAPSPARPQIVWRPTI